MSRSRRWTRRGLSGRSNLSASARPSTWRRWPEPPCTARPGRLVERDDVVVAPDDAGVDHRRVGLETRRARPAQAARVLRDRRHAHRLPGLEPCRRARPAAVDADLALAAHALDAALGDVRKRPAQPAVEPLVRLIGADGDLLDAAHGPFKARSCGLVKTRAGPRPGPHRKGRRHEPEVGGGGMRRGLGRRGEVNPLTVQAANRRAASERRARCGWRRGADRRGCGPPAAAPRRIGPR